MNGRQVNLSPFHSSSPSVMNSYVISANIDHSCISYQYSNSHPDVKLYSVALFWNGWRASLCNAVPRIQVNLSVFIIIISQFSGFRFLSLSTLCIAQSHQCVVYVIIIYIVSTDKGLLWLITNYNNVPRQKPALRRSCSRCSPEGCFSNIS